jgi:pimeloyl-ACP methyl ester carboxylesterase
MPTFEGPKGPVYYDYQIKPHHPVLLLLNGIMMSVDSWAPFVEPLLNQVSLLRVDFYDQGKSAHQTASYDQSLQVALLQDLLDHLNVTEVHLAGISYGASVALQWATQHPEKVTSLMIFNGVMKTNESLRKIGDEWNRVAESHDGQAYYEATIPMIYSTYFKTRQKEWMAARKTLLIDVFSHPPFLNRMIRLTQSAENHDVTDALKHLTMPILIVASDDDVLTPLAEQEAMAQRIPQAHCVIFHQTGHASMYERPQLFLNTLIGFITGGNHTFNI